MKPKHLLISNYAEHIKSEEQLTFFTESPFSCISIPNAVFAFHGTHLSQARIGGIAGTIYAFMKGGDKPMETALNIYAYPIRPIDDSKMEIDVKKGRQIDYHWTDKLPQIIEKSAPKWFKEKIEGLRKQSKTFTKNQ